MFVVGLEMEEGKARTGKVQREVLTTDIYKYRGRDSRFDHPLVFVWEKGGRRRQASNPFVHPPNKCAPIFSAAVFQSVVLSPVPQVARP